MTYIVKPMSFSIGLLIINLLLQSTVNYVLAGCQYDCCQPCDTEGCPGPADEKSSEPCCNCDAESDTAKVNVRKVFYFFEEKGWLKDRAEYSLYIFPPEHG